MKNSNIIILFLVIHILCGSCSQKICTKNNFFSKYKKIYPSYDMNNTPIEFDLNVKKKIFEGLCIDSTNKKLLVVEIRKSTSSSFTKGLIYTYSDSLFYYYELNDGMIKFGKGLNNFNQLQQIAISVKNEFSKGVSDMKSHHEKLLVYDAPSLRLILFDDDNSNKFEMFSFSYQL